MRQGNFLLILVVFATCTPGFAIAEQAIAIASHRSLRSTSKAQAADDTEERVQSPSIAKLSSFSNKESSVLKNLKENPALTKTLSGNPSLLKPFENNPQLVKTFEKLQKDTALMTRMESLKKSPSMDKLKTAISKNPSALTDESVEKLGAAVLNKRSSRLTREDERGFLYACGMMLLLTLGGTITLALTAGSRL